jgi:hypothetical protein
VRSRATAMRLYARAPSLGIVHPYHPAYAARTTEDRSDPPDGAGPSARRTLPA